MRSQGGDLATGIATTPPLTLDLTLAPATRAYPDSAPPHKGNGYLMKASLILPIILAFLVGQSCLSVAAVSSEQREETYRQLEIFSNVLSILQENYIDEIDSSSTIAGAIKGMLLSLDPHSSYLSAEDFTELQDETRGDFTGIGIEVTIRDGVLSIIAPISGTPAAKAGLRPKDRIVKIDNEITKEMPSMEAVKRLRGPAGSPVTVSIYREGWPELKEFHLIRARIPLKSVSGQFLEPGLAYLRISRFQGQTTTDAKKLLRRLRHQEDIKGLILDLRNNPGGLLDQAVSISDLFLEQGIVTSTRGRIPEQNKDFSAHTNNGKNGYPLVVLVNEGSASASEIVAGAIQDHKRGLIVGQQTFGKGSVQTILPLPKGAGLRITTARYYTPNGRSIQATGIIPDIKIASNPSAKPPARETLSPHITREVDLKNHILNTSTPETRDPASLPPQKAINTRLEQDQQLRSALRILKGLSLYSEYHDTSSKKITQNPIEAQ